MEILFCAQPVILMSLVLSAFKPRNDSVVTSVLDSLPHFCQWKAERYKSGNQERKGV